ncbi:MAG: electron transport complex subunit RsxA [Actinobacteria bacterium]|nr:MAG: electron transport complex subunit RsxA [Actinomycetota bacterium]
MLSQYFLIFLGASLVYNIILLRFIGLCPFFGVSNKMSTSVGMGFAVIFVMTVSSAASWILYYFVLKPLGVEQFLYIPTFILVIASLVQFEEMFLRKYSPTLYQSMGIYLPLITTNCAVLAAATESVIRGYLKLNIAYTYSFAEAIIYTFGVAVGFSLILIVFAAIRERIDIAPVPGWLKGPAISFMAAALMSLAFMGFANLLGL